MSLRWTSRRAHYAAQRAGRSSEEQLLLQKPQTAVLTPSTAHPFQTHHLVAVCFNRMAGRYCEHCEQLDRSLNNINGAECSPDSNRTLDAQGNTHGNRSSIETKQDGGEKGGSSSPPPTVGVFDKRLSKLRLQVAGLWARTGKISGGQHY